MTAAAAAPGSAGMEPAESDTVPAKPRMRGWLHAGMFPAVIVAGVALIAFTDSSRGRIACGIYILSACLLFGVSALYHRGTWGPRGEAVLRLLTTPTSS